LLEIVEISAADAAFAECFRLRVQVFVEEQNVPMAEERDAFDASARHFLARLDGTAIGTLRLLEPSPDVAKITRVAVLRPARGTGLGAALMRRAEAASNASIFLLDAQIQALGFYQRLGFEPFGEEFMEAGIAHRRMRKLRQLPAAALNQP
jgi:predicted GNAT family N-acyltransferase